jgi:RimJ/RimL family protein N-acetyltransferase
MELEFRQLTLSDLPAVMELTKTIWDGTDYLPGIIHRWIKNPKCFVFGGFYLNKLFGTANIRRITKDRVWLEGLRIDPRYHKQGYGHQMISYIDSVLKKLNFKIVQSDMYSLNQGSLKLGKSLGMNPKIMFHDLFTEIANISWNHKPKYNAHTIFANDAIKFLKTIHNNALQEFCVGWFFFPLESRFYNHPNWNWLRNKQAILLERFYNIGDEDESPRQNEVRYIVYGNPVDSQELLDAALERLLYNTTAKTLNQVQLFCPEEFAPIALKMNFRYWDNKPAGPILHEKIL